MKVEFFVFALLFFSIFPFARGEIADSNINKIRDLYTLHCSKCHGSDQLGGMGPALIKESLAELNKDQILKVISEGRPLTQMPSYKDILSSEQISMISEYLLEPSSKDLTWGDKEMESTRWTFQGALSHKPQFKEDPLNLFLVVEAGDHSISILDGDKFNLLFRFPTHRALHGGIKYSPDGRYAYLASRDGWITQFDIYNLKVVKEIRAGINTRNLAISSDGKYLAVANLLPQSVVILDSQKFTVLKNIEVKSLAGKPSRVSAVYTAPPRGSFIAALKDIPEIWEIPYVNIILNKEIISKESHLTKEKKNIVDTSLFQPKRVEVTMVVDDFFFDSGYEYLIGASRSGEALVVDLKSSQVLKKLSLAGMPHLGSGIEWNYKNGTIIATPNLKEPFITILDSKNWEVMNKIPTLGAGFFLRSHDGSDYAWADSAFSPQKDKIQLIDKKTLKVAQVLQPVPGKTASHVEFSRDGKYVLLSISEIDGEILVYDSKKLNIIKRVPMKKPSGKYNVYNKISYAKGTSH